MTGAAVAEPAEVRLEPRFRAPDGWHWGQFVTQAGARLRYGCVVPAAAAATLVLAPGLGEWIEKYFETVRWCAQQGYAVWILDWRGQGGSDRYPGNPQVRGSHGFEHDIADLERFASRVVTPAGPLVAVGHSMGGHLVLRHLHDHPGRFAAAALSAPMTAIATRRWPRAVLTVVAAAAERLGQGGRYLPGMADWTPERERLRSRRLTSDPARGGLQLIWFEQHPHLRSGGPSWRWLSEALRSMALMRQPAALARIAVPVLVGSAGHDHLVRAADHARVVRLLPRGELIRFPDARHELFLERDEIRTTWLAALRRLVEGARR